MKELLSNIENGSFAKEWVEEAKRGAPELLRRRNEEAESLVEKVGAELRRKMQSE